LSLIQKQYYYLLFVYLGREWIRLPTIIYAVQSLTTMISFFNYICICSVCVLLCISLLNNILYAIVLAEQFLGEHKTPEPVVIFAAYIPFAIAPAFFLYRASGDKMFPTKQKKM